jgi:cysteine dioxygenase
MSPIPVGQLISGLCEIPEQDFGVGTVLSYLKRHPVALSSLQPYLFFSRGHYTRNLIFKNQVFELLAICWEVGQTSQIHNHHNQHCWMTTPVGRLRVQNFRVVEQEDTTGFCRLEATEAFDLDRELPAEVNPAEPVHQVLNLAAFNQRAVSLHLYSKPFDHCLVYWPDKQQYREIPLHYTSEYGKLRAGEKL